MPTVDSDALRDALACGPVPALLPAVAAVTGDLSLLRDEFRPDPHTLIDPEGGLSIERQREARELALEALTSARRGSGDAPWPRPNPPSPEALRSLLAFMVGDGNVDGYLPMFEEELDLTGDDLRAPRWTKDGLAPGREFTVAVIGAGMSGLLAAYRLGQAGIPYVVFEKNDDVGGTWFENRYPGCRVDVPNHLYSYSFAQHDDWPQHYSDRDVLLDYFRSCADRFGVREHTRFGTEVVSAAFSEVRGVWELTVRRPSDGTEETVEAHAVVSAVGQLNRPSFPDIPGRDRFAGPAFHSAEWDDSVELAGKRVAVIGTGASAVQLIPEVAKEAGELVVFQRTPNWFVPTADYHSEVSDGLRWLQRHLPSFSHWYRLWLFWMNTEGMLPAARRDPDWEHPERAVNAVNDMFRTFLAGYLEQQFADAPDLAAGVVPAYPPAAKRVLRDNGIWAATLKQDHVGLVTDKILEITERGVVTSDGTEHEVDVLVYGTGFQASKFLTPMRVVGRGGVDLHEHWDGTARAYLGITIPAFPNFFCLYGPNTNLVVNGSIIYFSECEVHYVLECLRMLLGAGARAIDCRPDVHDAYNERIEAANREMVWGVSSVNSWYKNEQGRVTQNWPFSLLEFWQQTKSADPDDYAFLA